MGAWADEMNKAEIPGMDPDIIGIVQSYMAFQQAQLMEQVQFAMMAQAKEQGGQLASALMSALNSGPVVMVNDGVHFDAYA